jgi:hypothetical protein
VSDEFRSAVELAEDAGALGFAVSGLLMSRPAISALVRRRGDECEDRAFAFA